MKKIMVTFILGIGLLSCVEVLSSTQVEFNPSKQAVENCPGGYFDKSAEIFGVLTICGTQDVPFGKLQHAANVAAQWLDNDQDGTEDDPDLINILKAQRPIVLMSKDGFPTLVGAKIMMAAGDRPSQDLSATETNPKGNRRDASQEEIHHIIMNAGWIKLFPETFSDQPAVQSKLFKIWKFANDNSYYAYNDPSCDDACKVTEFVYLASAAYLGSAADLVSDEMGLKDISALKSTIPGIIDIFESSEYVYPLKMWPNGHYPVDQNIEYHGTKS